ncbi:hypothetical protein [Ligilactobacillus equi]|nr:hypothetical protein [Ligilactobacillus equi]KRL84312.1 hypothetical protein FC36_GL000235 [Ligilactobacillus equi DSM 15833 = JCM 10991]
MDINTEEDWNKHIEECDALLSKLPNCECYVTVDYIDTYNRSKHETKELKLDLEDYYSLLDTLDIKNGYDVLLTDDNQLVFKVFGGGYEYKGKFEMVKTLVVFNPKSNISLAVELGINIQK